MRVYLDNAATTPLHPKVFEKMLPLLKDDFGNPSSIHSFGRKTRVIIEDARETIADIIGANPSEIYFTSGGTEANNFSVLGIAKAEHLESGKNKIITSKGEHHCVLDSFADLSKQGFDVDYICIDKDTGVNVSEINSLLLENHSLLSLIHINNETGTINPILDVSNVIKNKNIYFHSDIVQSFGKVPLNVNELGVDSISASAHKINGPKGIGFSYIRSGTPVIPLIHGGSQERNRRGGTENVAAIAGFAEAVKISKESMMDNFNHVKKIREIFIEGLKSIFSSKIRINGGNNVLPYITSFTLLPEFFKNDAESLLMYLDINGVAASNGAACTSGTLKPSHVILNAGYSVEDANGTLRFSFGSQNTSREIEFALDVLNKLAKKFSK